MRVPELVTPLIVFAIALHRKIQRKLPLEYGEVRREVLSLFTRIEADAKAKSMSERWNRAKIALVYLLDEIAIMEPWSGSEMWSDHSLEVEYLGHAEKMRGVWFFDREYAYAIESGDAELVEVLYDCLCLGFEGKYRGQPAQLKQQIDNLYARLSIVGREKSEKLFPQAYHVDPTRGNPKAPRPILTLATVLAVVVLLYLVLNHFTYEWSVRDLREVVNALPTTK